MEQLVSDSGQALDVSVHLVSKVKDVTRVLIDSKVMAVRNVLAGSKVICAHV